MLEKQWRDKEVIGEKGWGSVNTKKINIKNSYNKLERKKDNDMDIDVAQLECSNNKCYVSAFRYIYIYI